jgi:hypothetical protein
VSFDSLIRSSGIGPAPRNTNRNGRSGIGRGVDQRRKSQASLTAAEERQTVIEERIRALDAERVATIQRRAQGRHEADDAGRLALNAADREGLVGMLGDAAAVVATARQPAEEARRQISFAQNELRKAEAEAEEAEILNWLRTVDPQMLTAITRLAELGRITGKPIPPWGPSPQLVTALTRVRAARREL